MYSTLYTYMVRHLDGTGDPSDTNLAILKPCINSSISVYLLEITCSFENELKYYFKNCQQ